MDVATAMGRLEGTSIHPLRRIASWATRATLLPEPEASEAAGSYRRAAPAPAARVVADEARRRAAEQLSFRRIGAFRQRTLVVNSIDCESFLDPEGTVRLSLGRKLEAFDTYFDDGSYTMTWSRLPGEVVLPSQRAAIAKTGRIGTGELADDLALHRARVAELVGTGLTPLRMGGVDDYLKLERHFVLRHMPLASAINLTLGLFFFVAIGGIVVVRIMMTVLR